MRGKFQRCLLVLVVSAGAAFGVWKYGEGAPVDREAFSLVAGSFANPPLFVSGLGTHASPWQLRVFSNEVKTDRRQAPVIVSLGDDVEGFFQSSPPAPIDMAVILSNFHRLGAKKAATSVVLAWEEPDPIGFVALEKALGKFDSLVMASPVSRGPVPSQMPASFRRASIPFSSLAGHGSSIPVVNRIPLPGVVFGGESSLTGFSVIETESGSSARPLLARWEDRLVFAFPLLVVMQRLDLPLEGMEIKPGKYLKLSADGPIIPIDHYGRLSSPPRAIAGFKEIPAEALIDGGEELFPKEAPEPVILRDDRSGAEPATRDFSRTLSGTIAMIGSQDSMAKLESFPRLKKEYEFAIMGVAVLWVTLACARIGLSRYVAVMVLAGVCLSAQWIALGAASVWLPGVPVLAAIVSSLAVARVTTRRAAPVAASGSMVPDAPALSEPPVPDVLASADDVQAPETPKTEPIGPAAPPAPAIAKPAAPSTGKKKPSRSKSSRKKKSPPGS